MNTAFQTALRLVYPPRCTLCGVQVESEFGLCGPCWRDTPFISGLCCEACGAPLPGQGDGAQDLCDDCLAAPRPWTAGRAAMLYRDNGRRLVLALKHGDRHDIVRPAAVWMANAIRPLVTNHALVVPVPLHWTRLLRRRYNQAALLAKGVARQLDLASCPDALQRVVRTRSLEGLGRDQRHAALQAAIKVNPRHRRRIAGRSILIVDDVMTSGATLSAAARACLQGGAGDVSILTLARAAKDA